MSDGLYQLVYSSVATLPTSRHAHAEAVEHLVQQATTFNEKTNLTGALMLQSGRFTHILEGELSNVERVYEKIAMDTNHRDIVILDIRPIEKRKFPGCPLAFFERSTENNGPTDSDRIKPTDDVNDIVKSMRKALRDNMHIR